MTDLTRVGVARQTSSLVDNIYDALFEAITTGVLEPGARLTEIPLSRHFGVSTTPVREALRRLTALGLVELSPNRGAVVATLNADEVANLYQVRILLEGGGARLAATSADPDFTQIDQLMRDAETVLDEPTQVAFNQLDVRLHRAINELSGNTWLAELAERTHLRIQAVRLRCAVHLPDRPAQSHRQHQRILDAIRVGDPDGAEAATVEHITSVRDAVTAALVDLS